MSHYTINKEIFEKFKAKRLAEKTPIAEKYTILGFISSGTYGRVYKAKLTDK
jgi:cyclin-dependent kinase 8/11